MEVMIDPNDHKKRSIRESVALDFLKAKGVRVQGRSIMRGSYSLRCWTCIDCLVNWHKYILVNQF